MALKEVLIASCMQRTDQRSSKRLDLSLDLNLNLNLNLKMASCMQRTDQRSRKSQPGVQVKKATISEGLELRELE